MEGASGGTGVGFADGNQGFGGDDSGLNEHVEQVDGCANVRALHGSAKGREQTHHAAQKGAAWVALHTVGVHTQIAPGELGASLCAGDQIAGKGQVAATLVAASGGRQDDTVVTVNDTPVGVQDLDNGIAMEDRPAGARRRIEWDG